MIRSLLGVLLTAGVVSAQYPYTAPGAPRPPMLSPYLNLTRGGSPVANYLFSARAPAVFGQVPMVQQNVGPSAGGFLPQSQIPVEAAPQQPYEPGGQPIRLASPAHGVLYGNQFANHGNYFSVYATNVNRGGFAPTNRGQQTFAAPRSATNGLGTINLQQQQQQAGGNQQATRRPPTITAFP